MEKLLLATTALVASTSFAMADGHIVFSGSAEAGVAVENNGTDSDDADGELDLYSNVKLSVAFSGSTDGGVEFGASASIAAGRDYDPGDFEFDGDEDEMLDFGNVYVSTGGVTITFDNEGIDDLYDSDMDSHDMSVAWSGGAFSVTVTHDFVEDGADDPDTDADGDGQNSFKIAYDGGAVSVSVAGSTGPQQADECTVLDASYSTGSIKVYGQADQGCGSAVNKIGVEYTADNFSVDVSVKDNDDWDASFSFTQDNVTVSASTDESDAWEITGSMDLGGGMSLLAGFNHDQDYYLGASMSF